MMNRLAIAFCTAVTILGGCTQPEKPNPLIQPPIDVPEFTPEEKETLILSLDFFRCVTDLHKNIPHPDIIRLDILELCSNVTGFNEQTFDALVQQYQNKYQDAWPLMIEGLDEEYQSMALTQ